MAVAKAQAQWDDVVWLVSVDALMPLGEISLDREIDIEKTDDSEGKPPAQIVRMKNDVMTVHFDLTRMTGTDPRNVFDMWYSKPGVRAPFYLNGWQLGEQDMLCTKVRHGSSIFDKNGLEVVGSFDVDFEGWFEEGGLKGDKGRYASLTRGVSEYYSGTLLTSIDVTASQNAKLAVLRNRGVLH